MKIPERILTCKPSTPLVITQELADELGIERKCTAGQIQEIEAKKKAKKSKKKPEPEVVQEVLEEKPVDEITNL